mmetsp:Transcript_19686/g.48417  ORF Transcript_19686/g.48417 Transcript_19686/m.48417 type:complete len:209 (+) Transcript_19686:581-1207(+)
MTLNSACTTFGRYNWWRSFAVVRSACSTSQSVSSMSNFSKSTSAGTRAASSSATTLAALTRVESTRTDSLSYTCRPGAGCVGSNSTPAYGGNVPRAARCRSSLCASLAELAAAGVVPSGSSTLASSHSAGTVARTQSSPAPMFTKWWLSATPRCCSASSRSTFDTVLLSAHPTPNAARSATWRGATPSASLGHTNAASLSSRRGANVQ